MATSELRDSDPEWAHRVALHRERRPESWRTTETLDLVPVLIDCVAVWFDRVLQDAGAWDEAPGWRDIVAAQTQALVEGVRATRRTVILVSNEVGLGVVPATPSGRLYRDELGRLNARLASAVDEVWFCVAGIAKRWA